MRGSGLWWIIGQGAVLLLIVVALALTVDLRRAATLIRAADWIPLGAAILGVQCQVLLSALRWRFTAARLGQQIPRATAIREYYVASLINHLLPGGMSGDALRTWRNRDGQRQPGGWRIPVQAVMLERLSGQLALIATGLAGLIAWMIVGQARLPVNTLMAAGAVVLAIAAVGGLVVLMRRVGTGRVAGFLRALGPSFRVAFVERFAWIVQGLLSLATVAAYLGCFALASLAVGTPLAPLAVVTLVPLVLLTMLVPISIAGWGVREATAAVLWPVIGAASADGVATSAVYGLVIIVGSLPGLWFVWRAPLPALHDHRAVSRRA